MVLRAEKSRMMERRAEILRQAGDLELRAIRQDLPQRLPRAEMRVVRIVGSYFGVDSIRSLQMALNARGSRDPEGRELAVTGRLDPGTVHSLLSYLHRAQELPNERLMATLMLTQLRAAIYPHLREGSHAEGWERLAATAETRGVDGIRAFLFAAGYRDFRNGEIGSGGPPGSRELFAILSYAGGITGEQARGIVSRRSARISVSELAAVPARVRPPSIMFPVQLVGGETSAEGRRGGIEWHRGSYGSHSRRSGAIHRAIDIFAPLGRPVIAPVSGTVVHVGANPNSPGGNVVIVTAEDGTSVLMSHLHTVGVREGQHVERGAQIGTVGRSGRGVDGTPVTDPHLHFEVFRGDIVRRGSSIRIIRRASYNPADLFY